MTTEQMDWLDDERAGRHKPVTLYGMPSAAELVDAHARAGDNGVLIVPAELDPRTTTEKEADENARQARIAREDGIVDITRYTEATLQKVREALHPLVFGTNLSVADIINAMQNAGILFRERAPEYEAVPADQPDAWTTISARLPRDVPRTPIAAYNVGWKDGRASMAARVTDQEEHTHRTREARDRCAAGDHEAAVFFDKQADAIVPEFAADYTEEERVAMKVREAEESEMATQAELPVEYQVTDAFLDGYSQGFREGRHGRRR